LDSRRFLWALVVSAPMGFLALELGWVVTEVGRQPWIIHGIMKTKDAVTPVPGQVWHLALFTGLYAMIGISTVWMWRRQVRYAKAMPGPSAELQAWVKGGK